MVQWKTTPNERNLSWREPFFTSMIMGGRVIALGKGHHNSPTFTNALRWAPTP